MLQHSENKTTVKKGEVLCTTIADSISKKGIRISTVELVYPRYIHSELLTHRMFSRNSASSRCTPVVTNVHEVINDPAFFNHVGLNTDCLSTKEGLSSDKLADFEREWKALGHYVADIVDSWAIKYNIHKQVLNRPLEPWLRIRTLVTATEWDNFFQMRCTKYAQAEIRDLANAIGESIGMSLPDTKSGKHMPYITDADRNLGFTDEQLSQISAARCARVSYARLGAIDRTIEDDFMLFKKFMSSVPKHLSPLEHVAFDMGDEQMHANFLGWQSFRTRVENKEEECS